MIGNQTFAPMLKTTTSKRADLRLDPVDERDHVRLLARIDAEGVGDPAFRADRIRGGFELVLVAGTPGEADAQPLACKRPSDGGAHPVARADDEADAGTGLRPRS